MSRYNLTVLTLALAGVGAIGAFYKFRDAAPYSTEYFDANYLVETYNKEYFDAAFAAVRSVPHVVAPAWFNGSFGTLDPVSIEAPVVAAGP